MNKIVLSGYYGFNNAGDELVLSEIIRNIKEMAPDCLITVLSADPIKTSRKYNVKSVNRWKILEIIKSIKENDLLVSGGGSLLQDKTSRNGILYYLGVIFLGKLLGKKVIIFSQGVGPVDEKRNIFLTRSILNILDYLSVRDEGSQEFLNNAGVKKEIELAADPVFLIEQKKKEPGEILKVYGLNPGKKLIIVALRPWKNIEKVIQVTGKFLESFSREIYEIIYLPMHFEADLEILQGRVPEEEIFSKRLEPEEIGELISAAEMVIGMRLHSLILAAASGKKFIAISYDPKVEIIDKEIYGNSGLINTENIDCRLLEEKYQIVSNSSPDISEIKKRARLPFEYLRTYFLEIKK